ncbi:hypothetical protein HAX54_025265 [Datura stramonium]|uniref:Uncharacterized protein n=1 Tax=Datura stramonium TaxID=4076 RepID=A0ABS8S7P9_DATST|nr:hypothetical protein [Datura stramonium]
MPGVHNVLNSLAGPWNWVISTISALSTDQKNFLSSIASLKLHLQNFEASHQDSCCSSSSTPEVSISRACCAIFQPHTYSRLAALKDDSPLHSLMRIGL